MVKNKQNPQSPIPEFKAIRYTSPKIIQPDAQGIFKYNGKEYGSANPELDRLIKANLLRDQIRKAFLPRDNNKKIIRKYEEQAKAFEKEMEKVHSLRVKPFWYIIKCAIDAYQKQKNTVEKQRRTIEKVESLKRKAEAWNAYDLHTKKMVEGGIIKQPAPFKPGEEIQPVIDPFYNEDLKRHPKQEEPITLLITKIMDDLTQQAVSKHKASRIISDFIRIYLSKEYPYSPDTIRRNYLRIKRSSK